MDRAVFLRISQAFVIGTAMLLAACGGGTGDTATGAPIANPDSADVNENTPITLAVLANDVPRESGLDRSSVKIWQQPVHGSATVNGDGSVTYIPASGVAAVNDGFRYSVKDAWGAESNATDVRIYINAIPQANTACWDTVQTTSVTGYLPATDAETPNLLTYTIDPDQSGTKGTATVTDASTGQFVYTPNRNGLRGWDTFRYEVTDPQGATAQGTVAVVIAPRVMPLGDSITAGVNDGSVGLPVAEARVGYRAPLATLLADNSYPFDFVGTQNFGALAMSDPDNEGHGGWSAREVAYGRLGDGRDGVYAWLSKNPADAILLHIGTNQLSTTTADDVAAILDEVDRWESNTGNSVHVIIARIIDQTPRNAAIPVFNEAVAAMVNDRVYNPKNPAYPDQVRLVDQYNALVYPNDLADGLHPNSDGYGKMAGIWFDELSRILDKCP